MSETTREEALRALIEDHKETARLMREGGGHLHALTHDAFVIGLRNVLAMPALPWVSVEERLPDVDDQNDAGDVLWLSTDGGIHTENIGAARGDVSWLDWHTH